MTPRKCNRLYWTPAHDARLMDLISQGCTLEQCAKRIGTSRNSAIGRFHKLRLAMGWQAQ